MKTFDLERLEKEINQFASERDWNQFHSIKNLSMALSVEASELLEIFQWMSEIDSNNIKSDENKMTMVKDEIADVLIYLIRISSLLEIDLGHAVSDKILKNIQKYPAAKVYGNSKKYTEY